MFNIRRIEISEYSDMHYIMEKYNIMHIYLEDNSILTYKYKNWEELLQYKIWDELNAFFIMKELIGG